MHAYDHRTDVAATVHEGRIYVKSPFAYKDVAKTINGYRWHPESKRWHYPADPTTASAIRKAYALCAPMLTGIFCDEAVLQLLAQSENIGKAVERSRATDLPQIPGVYCECETPQPGDPDKQENQYLCMKCLRALNDMLHQRQAYALLKDQSGAAAMGMGTGKTKLYISLLDGNDAQLAIIVTTKKGRRVFPKQFTMHSERDWLVFNGVRGRDGNLKKSAPLTQYVAGMEAALNLGAMSKRPVALVVHYDVIWRSPMRDLLLELLKADKPYVIYDESHRIKSPGGKASKTAAAFQPHARRVWLGTGSFMAHTKLDVYAQCRAMNPAHFGTNFARFRNRFAVMGGFENHEIMGWQNEELFNDTLANFTFFADTDDVLDLPPIQHFTEYVELSTEAKGILKQLESGFIAEVEDGTVTATNALTKLLRQQQVTSGHVVIDDDGSDEGSTVRTIDNSKQEALAEILRDLPPREKVVVFARFTHDLAAIRQAVEDSGRVYGEVSGQREDLTQDATFPDHIDVLGVQIQAGSEAVDFTAARYAVYYSLGFSLKDYEQSLRRVHRPGQTRETFYYHLIAKGTVDEKVYSALAQRKAVIQAVIDYVKNGGDVEVPE